MSYILQILMNAIRPPHVMLMQIVKIPWGIIPVRVKRVSVVMEETALVSIYDTYLPDTEDFGS